MKAPKMPRRERAKAGDGANTLSERLRRRFPHIALAVTILLGAAAGIDWIVSGAEKIKIVAQWFEPVRQILPYVEIVIDRSKQMDRPLNDELGETKWTAALQAFRRLDLANTGYLALRTFGGPCTDDLGPPDIPFELNVKDKVNSVLGKLTPTGEGNLANAVIAAMNDFIDTAKFQGTSLRIIVITGTVDGCTSDQIAAIQNHQRNYPNSVSIILNFRFIGVALADQEKKTLEKIRETSKGEIIYVKTRDEINQALRTFLIREPMEDNVSTLLEIMNDCIQRLNKVIDKPGAGTADADFRAARDECKRSDQPFRDLGNRQEQELGSDFKLVYERISENWSMRERIIGVVEKLITTAKSGDVEGYNSSMKEFREIEDTYDRQVEDLNPMWKRIKSQH